jgi:Phage integrase, N-terminal SAM-like domain
MSVTPSNPKPISPLRARMFEDMTVHNFIPDTQREYIRAVKKLAVFLGGRSPDTATAQELRAFQLHLTKTGSTGRGSSSLYCPVATVTIAPSYEPLFHLEPV